MPGFVIHLAVGQEYIKNHKIDNQKNFLKGCIMPDLLDKKTSHYGKWSSNPNLSKYLSENSLDSDYNKGYFLHLVTDFLFYSRIVKEFSPEIYNDYGKINSFLIEKYGVDVPQEISPVIRSIPGEPQILNPDTVCKFIDTVSQIDLEKIKRK